MAPQNSKERELYEKKNEKRKRGEVRKVKRVVRVVDPKRLSGKHGEEKREGNKYKEGRITSKN